MAATWREERPDATTAASAMAPRPSRSMVMMFSALSSSSEAMMRLRRSLCGATLAFGFGAAFGFGFGAAFFFTGAFFGAGLDAAFGAGLAAAFGAGLAAAFGAGLAAAFFFTGLPAVALAEAGAVFAAFLGAAFLAAAFFAAGFLAGAFFLAFRARTPWYRAVLSCDQ